jgi:hypothetical protein
LWTTVTEEYTVEREGILDLLEKKGFPQIILEKVLLLNLSFT